MSLTPAQVLEARRRKVRKGTHSCWECRRRKIRCQFASPDDALCIGCRARGSTCRSQEFADETPSPPPPGPEKKVAQRLDRLESMMEQLMTHVMAGPAGTTGSAGSTDSAGSDRQTPQHTPPQPWPSSGVPSDAEDTSLEHMHKIYKDPAEIVAHVCPRAAGKQGYGMLDVLETSTADDTPVAAMLGIQDLSCNGSGSSSTAQDSHTSAPSASSAAANASANSTNSPSTANGSTNSTSIEASGSGSAADSTDTAITAATRDTPATQNVARYSTRGTDPVSEEWRRHQNLSRLLWSLFPTQEDIYTIASGPPTQYIATLFHSQHDIAAGRSEPLAKLREVPPMTSHPAVLARRLLQLTLCMQQMAPCFTLQNKLRLPETLSDVINRIAGVVSHTVASNDELIGSVEGLECLVLLGQQQSSAGQLRKAWLSYRRAMSLAQLMGLDRGNTRALKSCDPAADPRTRPTPAALWFRINACDRYASLLLGLRAGCQDDDGYAPATGPAGTAGAAGSAPRDDTDTPVEKLEKAHTILTGRIIERNHSQISLKQSYSVTRAIDEELQAAVASCQLGSTWWDLPSYDPYAQPDVVFREMARSILQVHHHCILILLHLPYMLRGEHPAAATARMMVAPTAPTPGSQGNQSGQSGQSCQGSQRTQPQADGARDGTPDPELESRPCCRNGLVYSKATCLQSSRAVLQRFIHFRLLVNTAFSCRHVDYASLIAAMTLLIGYLGPRPASSSEPHVLDAFDRQLCQDRAMVEQVRERMAHIGQVNGDKLSRESAATIQKLMPILDLVAKKPDADVAPAAVDHSNDNNASGCTGTVEPSHGVCRQESGSTPNAMPSFPTSVGPGAGPGPGQPAATNSAVRLNVPYFGTVNIHTSTSAGPSSGPSPPYAQTPPTAYSAQPLPPDLSMPCSVSYDLVPPPANDQPVLDWSGPPQQQQHAHDADAVDLNAMLVDFDPMSMGGDSPPGLGMPSFGGGTAFPDMTGSSDDWVMQGVDTTYWSLLNGGGGSFGGQMG